MKGLISTVGFVLAIWRWRVYISPPVIRKSGAEFTRLKLSPTQPSSDSVSPRYDFAISDTVSNAWLRSGAYQL